PPPPLHPLSFPTRRSSDLVSAVVTFSTDSTLQNVDFDGAQIVNAGLVDPSFETTNSAWTAGTGVTGAYVSNASVAKEGSGYYEIDRKSTRLNSSHVAISYA